MSRTAPQDQPFTVAFSLTRLLPADRSTVFRAWTTPEGLSGWFRAPGFDVPLHRVTFDARAGGAGRMGVVGPDGVEQPVGGTVRELDEPRRLVITAGDPANTDGELASVLTLQLVDDAAGTSMHFHQAGVNTPPHHGREARQGWERFFDQLEEYVAR